MQCPTCQQPVSEDERFCPACGQQLLRAGQEAIRGLAVELGGEFFYVASFWRRFSGVAIDTVFLWFFFGAIYLDYAVAPSPASSLAFTWGSAMLALLFLVLEILGTSPGKRAVGIRATRIDGQRPGPVHGLTRSGIKLISAAPFLLGYFWALSDARRRTWHDRAAATVVVHLRPGGHWVERPRDDFGVTKRAPLVVGRATPAFALIATLLLGGSQLLQFYTPTIDPDLIEPSEYVEVVWNFEAVHPVPDRLTLVENGAPEPRSGVCNGRLRRICLVPIGDESAVDLAALAEHIEATFGLDVEVMDPLLLSEPYAGAVVDQYVEALVADGVFDLMEQTFPELIDDPRVALLGVTPHDAYGRTVINYSIVALRGQMTLVSSARLDPAAFGHAEDPELVQTRVEKIVSRDVALANFGRDPHEFSPALPEEIVFPSDVDAIPGEFHLPGFPLTFAGVGLDNYIPTFEADSDEWRACAVLDAGPDARTAVAATVAVFRADGYLVAVDSGRDGPGPLRCLEVSEAGLFYLSVTTFPGTRWHVDVGTTAQVQQPPGRTLQQWLPAPRVDRVSGTELTSFHFASDAFSLPVPVPVRDFQLCWDASVTSALPGRFVLEAFMEGAPPVGAWPVEHLPDGGRGCLPVEAPQTGEYYLHVSELSAGTEVQVRFDFEGLPLREDAAVDVAVGGTHACALMDSGDVVCWGSNEMWELGLPQQGAGGLTLTAEVPLPGPAGTLDAGFGFSCATVGRIPYCWGLGTGDLALALNLSETNAYLPTRVPTAHNLAPVAVGFRHACGIIADGDVECWGDNIYGALGSPVAATGFNAMQLSEPITQIVSGGDFTCGLGSESAAAWCWGLSEDGRLGSPGLDLRVPVPVRVPLDARVVALTTGFAHACAVTIEDAVWCWGSNREGQLQRADREPSYAPVRIDTPVLTDISAGLSFTCGVTEASTVVCWGSNDHGQAGSGEFGTDVLEPRVVAGLPPIQTVDAGWSEACAISLDHEVWCWGGDFTRPPGPDAHVPHLVNLREALN